jgi:peptide/nickel transport system permease protein
MRRKDIDPMDEKDLPKTKRERAERVAADASAAQSAETDATGKKRASSYWAVSWGIFKRNKLGVFCLGVVVALVLVAIFAPLLAPYDPDKQTLSNMLQSPSAAHPFGTDEYGRDILSRVIYGCRVSLSVGVVSQVISVAIGFFAGVCAGYFGGKVDAVISFVIQVFSSFPFLLFAIVVMYVMGPGLINLYVALGLLGWTSTARLIRGDVMRLKGSEYIQSCMISGGKPMRIILKHLLPNCVSTIIVVSTLGIPGAILSEASLSYLGLGVQPPTASWGSMISSAQTYIQTNTYYSLIPGLAIIITVMAFNLVGDALRDALDPKMRS